MVPNPSIMSLIIMPDATKRFFPTLQQTQQNTTSPYVMTFGGEASSNPVSVNSSGYPEGGESVGFALNSRLITHVYWFYMEENKPCHEKK
jgi:hypothetical protein